jgi:hypothetical protein
MQPHCCVHRISEIAADVQRDRPVALWRKSIDPLLMRLGIGAVVGDE